MNMLQDIVNLFMELIATLIVGAGFIWVILFVFKRDCQRKKNKKGLKQIEKVELKLKNIGKSSWRIFQMVITMVFCTILAIAVKPIIYKLNVPLGEGYSTFASYMIAICLWNMLRPKNNGGSR